MASERWGAFILKMCWGVVGSGYLRTGLGQRAVGSVYFEDLLGSGYLKTGLGQRAVGSDYFEDVLGSGGEWIFEDWPWPASGGERLF